MALIRVDLLVYRFHKPHVTTYNIETMLQRTTGHVHYATSDQDIRDGANPSVDKYIAEHNDQDASRIILFQPSP